MVCQVSITHNYKRLYQHDVLSCNNETIRKMCDYKTIDPHTSQQHKNQSEELEKQINDKRNIQDE